eukprot:c17638_g2_i1 orf=356-1357(+)
MEEGGVVALSRPILSRPKIVVPPRNPNEGFIRGGLNSATPTPTMSFVSSLLAEQDPYASLSPLLAEALGSPEFKTTAFFNNLVNNRSFTDLLTSGNGDEKETGIESDGIGETHVEAQLNASARYKAMMPSRLPISSSSTHLTIPPGISPASLLESPILFSMSQADPSPTTGSFCIRLSGQERGLQSNASMDEDSVSSPGKHDGFMFKPYPLEEKCGSPVNINMGTFGTHFEETEQSKPQIKSEPSWSTGIPASDSTLQRASSISFGLLEPQDHPESRHMASMANRPSEKGPTSYASGVAHHPNGRLSIDGYNWKKYGQKQLKNCENPRSYYKC